MDRANTKASGQSVSAGSDGQRLAYGIATLVTLFAAPHLWTISVLLYTQFFFIPYGDDASPALLIIAVMSFVICFFAVVVTLTGGLRLVILMIGSLLKGIIAIIRFIVVVVAVRRPRQPRQYDYPYEE